MKSTSCHPLKVAIPFSFEMTGKETLPCRKCGAPNPLGNEYCRKCGAVLSVATAEVKAQRKPVLPAVKQLKWGWAFLGALIMLGIITILLGAVFFLAKVVFDVKSAGASPDLRTLASDFLGVSIIAALAFLAAFGLGGAAVSWMSRSRLVLEPAIGAFMVLALLAVIGSVLSRDLGIAAGVMLMPSAALAALGGRLGVALVERAQKK